MKLRKLLIALLAAALLCTAVGAAGYSDLPDTHWANKQAAYLQGEIKGYPDGTFRPNNTVTRAEFLTMFARVAYPEEYQAQEASAWWQPAYAVCTAHELLADITGDRAEPMPRHEIASLLGRFCSGWGGMNESTSAAMPLNINWKEQRLESPERQPIFSDTAKYERSSDNIRFCANQGLLTGYPDGSFQPDKGVTRAEAATVIARLKAQLSLREKGCDYVCTVGQYWLMQCQTEKTRSLALYEPYTGKLHETIFSRGKTAADVGGPLAATLLIGSDGMYVWGEAGLYKRSGDALEQITADPVFDFCWSGYAPLLSELGCGEGNAVLFRRRRLLPVRLAGQAAHAFRQRCKDGLARKPRCAGSYDEPDEYLCRERKDLYRRLVLYGHGGLPRRAL